MRAKEAEARQRKKEREEARMAADPEYAAMMEARKKEYIRTRTARRKAEHEALVELAKTDEEAARKLAEKRKYQSEATVKMLSEIESRCGSRRPGSHQTIRSPPCQAQRGLPQKESRKGGYSSMNELWIVRFVRARTASRTRNITIVLLPKQSITRACFWTMIPGCMSALKSSTTNIKEDTMELNFIKSGDYYIPDIQLQNPEYPSWKVGLMRKSYLRIAQPFLFFGDGTERNAISPLCGD